MPIRVIRGQKAFARNRARFAMQRVKAVPGETMNVIGNPTRGGSREGVREHEHDQALLWSGPEYASAPPSRSRHCVL
jgi:hypothetical protein